MQIEKARTICRLVDGDEIKDGLSTVALALIHLAFTHGFNKQDALDAMSGQWDLYLKYKGHEERLN